MMLRLNLLNTYFSLILTYIFLVLPFSTYMLTGYCNSIPTDLDDAALVDGCSRLRALFSVILPLLSPGLVATALYIFIIAWQEFIFAMLFLEEAHLFTLPLSLLFYRSQYYIRWGQLMAASIVTVMPVTILFVWLQRRLIAGLTKGAVKA